MIPVADQKRTKRENGQGSFCKRKDGRWSAKMQVGWNDNGKPKMKYMYGKSLPEVKRKLKEYREDFIKNGRISVQNGTVKSYMENWLVTVKKNQIKPSSYDKIEYAMEAHIYPAIGDIQLANLTSDDIQKLVNKLYERYSYSTISQTYHIMNDCFKLATVRREIPFNPALGVVLPKKNVEELESVKFFTEVEVEKIVVEATRKTLTGLNAHRLGWALILLLYTGMRYGELSALKWENVDLENRQINVQYTMARIRNRNKENGENAYILVRQEPKTKASRRIIPLNNKGYEAICELKKVTGDFEYVIANKQGSSMLPASFQNLINGVLNKCGVKVRGPHTFRHTFASMLFKKGVDVKTVSELLGHTNVSITYNTYIHLIQEQKVTAVQLIDF